MKSKIEEHDFMTSSMKKSAEFDDQELYDGLKENAKIFKGGNYSSSSNHKINISPVPATKTSLSAAHALKVNKHYPI